jgi:hypothetical protein
MMLHLFSVNVLMKLEAVKGRECQCDWIDASQSRQRDSVAAEGTSEQEDSEEILETDEVTGSEQDDLEENSVFNIFFLSLSELKFRRSRCRLDPLPVTL